MDQTYCTDCGKIAPRCRCDNPSYKVPSKYLDEDSRVTDSEGRVIKVSEHAKQTVPLTEEKLKDVLKRDLGIHFDVDGKEARRIIYQDVVIVANYTHNCKKAITGWPNKNHEIQYRDRDGYSILVKRTKTNEV